MQYQRWDTFEILARQPTIDEEEARGQYWELVKLRQYAWVRLVTVCPPPHYYTREVIYYWEGTRNV